MVCLFKWFTFIPDICKFVSAFRPLFFLLKAVIFVHGIMLNKLNVLLTMDIFGALLKSRSEKNSRN